MTDKQIRKAHRTLKRISDKLPFLKEHYEDLGYKFVIIGVDNDGFLVSKNGVSVSGESYCGRFSIGYGGYKYKTINAMVERINSTFAKEDRDTLKRTVLKDVQTKFIQALNHSDLPKIYDERSVTAYSLPLYQTVSIGENGETNVSITVTTTGNPVYTTRSTNPQAFIDVANFAPIFTETWEAAQL